MMHYSGAESAGQTGSENGGSLYLGIYAKFAAAFSEGGPGDWTVRRFALQAAARELLPENRISDCLRKPIPGSSAVEIWHSTEHQRAHFKRLMTCGGVWSCPVCASRITEVRRVELQAALDQGKYAPVLETFTVRHSVDDDLAGLLDGLLDGYRQYTRNRGFKRLIAGYGVVGAARTLEVTYGENGWHPHLHVLRWFRTPLVDSDQYLRDVKLHWLESVGRAGLDASWEHGADVKDGWRWMAEYVAKWGREPVWTLDYEIAKGNVKLGRQGGRTPFQLLADYMSGDEQAGRLYQEYVKAFKGKAQLRWSPGMRDAFGLGAAASDVEIAAGGDEPAWLLASLTLDQWREIERRELRGQVLAAAHAGDIVAFDEFMDGLGLENRKYHQWERSPSGLRPGDGVKWMDGDQMYRGYVREVMHSRVLVDVWGTSKRALVWVDGFKLRLVDERG